MKNKPKVKIHVCTIYEQGGLSVRIKTDPLNACIKTCSIDIECSFYVHISIGRIYVIPCKRNMKNKIKINFKSKSHVSTVA